MTIVGIILIAFIVCMLFMLYEMHNAPEMEDEPEECRFCIDRWISACPLNGGTRCPYKDSSGQNE